MNTVATFHLPDVGEGLTEAEIVTWRIGVGDDIAVNDVIAEIETAKSIVELPSPYAGAVATLHAEEGETVAVGAPLVSIATDGDAVADDSAEVVAGEADASTDAPAPPAPAAEPVEAPLVLVGSAPKAAPTRKRRLGGRTATAEPSALAEGTSGEAGKPDGASGSRQVLATPPVRALAVRLGVDLALLAGELGRPILREDVQSAAAQRTETPTAASAESPAERRVPIKGVLKAMGQAMVRSSTIPHVTEWLSVDVTEMMHMIARLKRSREWSGVRVTPLLFVAKALVMVAARNPRVNSVWNEEEQVVIEKLTVNLGIAAATPRGLLVPNVKHADALDLRGLAEQLDTLIETARSGQTSPADLADGTISLTNIGSLGVDAGTPIINPGESAILAFGRVQLLPWVVNDEIVPRQITQLALSFDHRHIDGELGSRVLTEVAAILSNPGETFLYS